MAVDRNGRLRAGGAGAKRMSQRREKAKRRAYRESYEYRRAQWLSRRPSKLRFWAYRKWKREEPRHADGWLGVFSWAAYEV